MCIPVVARLVFLDVFSVLLVSVNCFGVHVVLVVIFCLLLAILGFGVLLVLPYLFWNVINFYIVVFIFSL